MITTRLINRSLWITGTILTVAIGFYPLIYFIFDMKTNGLLATKSPELLQNFPWNGAFYAHITFGGLALLAGWTQFSKKIRAKRLSVHKMLGKIYVISVLAGGCAGFYLALYATGALWTRLGFATLAVSWLFTTIQAYRSIREKNLRRHELWMIRSYALCFAAVTLRLWLPTLQIILGMSFMEAYQIIAWLCWTPNLVVAEAIVYAKTHQRAPKREIRLLGDR